MKTRQQWTCPRCGRGKAVLPGPVHCICGARFNADGSRLRPAGRRAAGRGQAEDGHAMAPCRHRGRETSKTLACGGCGGELAIYDCRHFDQGAVLRLTKPGLAWKGGVCITCELREP